MFTKTLLIGALAALATAQSSVLSFTRVPSPITAGEAQAITYATNDTASPVTIRLRKGASGNLDTVATLSDSVMNGQYIWTPSDSLENANDYALEISQKGQVNYFGPFSIQGASGSSSSSSSSSASTSSATSASSYSSSTAPAMLNSTRTSSSLTMMGTGMTMPSYNSTNATMTSATLSMTRTSSTSRPTNTDDLSMGGTTTGSDAPASTGAAAILGSSAIAIVFGAAAAVLMG